MIVQTATQISLEVACGNVECSEFAWPLLRQLDGGNYDACSVMPLTDLASWRREHRTARKRADRAERRGYMFAPVMRHLCADEIYEINTSASVRQGRPMSAGYRQRPSIDPLPNYPCARHGVHTYGVKTAAGRLIAYLWIYRAGELALVSQILGHADHLENEVMYLLFQGMLERESAEPGFVVYNRHDSGTDGLRFFKERLGLAETPVRWLS